MTLMNAISFRAGGWEEEDRFSLSFLSGFLSGYGKSACYHFQIIDGTGHG